MLVTGAGTMMPRLALTSVEGIISGRPRVDIRLQAIVTTCNSLDTNRDNTYNDLRCCRYS